MSACGSSSPEGCECRCGHDSRSKAGPEPLRLGFLLCASLPHSLPPFCFHSNSTFVVFHCARSVPCACPPGSGWWSFLSLLLLPQLPRALVHVPKRPLPFSRVSGTSILSPMGQARRVSLRGCNCPAHTAVSSWILASSLQDWTPWQWFLQPPGCPGVCRPPWPLWVCFWSPVWWFLGKTCLL